MEMTALNAALLVNLIGFTVGVALYALIAAMVVMHRPKTSLANVDLLLLTTAVLGLLRNLGELYSFIQKDFAAGGISPWLAAVSFSALGFLPSVVVHSAQADDEGTHWLTYAAYGLSTVAAALHFYSAATANAVPSGVASISSRWLWRSGSCSSISSRRSRKRPFGRVLCSFSQSRHCT